MSVEFNLDILCGLSPVDSDYLADAGAVMQGPATTQGPAKRRKLLLISKHAEPRPAASNGSTSVSTPEKDDQTRPKQSKSAILHPSPNEPSQPLKQSSAGLRAVIQRPECAAESDKGHAVTEGGLAGLQQAQRSPPVISTAVAVTANKGSQSTAPLGGSLAGGDSDAGRLSHDKMQLPAEKQHVSNTQSVPSPSLFMSTSTAKPLSKAVPNASTDIPTVPLATNESDTKCAVYLLMVRRLPAVLNADLPTMESLGVLTDLPTGADVLSKPLLLLPSAKYAIVCIYKPEL